MKDHKEGWLSLNVKHESRICSMVIIYASGGHAVLHCTCSEQQVVWVFGSAWTQAQGGHMPGIPEGDYGDRGREVVSDEVKPLVTVNVSIFYSTTWQLANGKGQSCDFCPATALPESMLTVFLAFNTEQRLPKRSCAHLSCCGPLLLTCSHINFQQDPKMCHSLPPSYTSTSLLGQASFVYLFTGSPNPSWHTHSSENPSPNSRWGASSHIFSSMGSVSFLQGVISTY